LIIHNNKVFVHIPKTGGTSLQDALVVSCGIAKTPHDYINWKKHATVREIINKFGEPKEWITILRNPYERMVSYYYFMLRIHKENLYGAGKSKEVMAAVKSKDFKDWLKKVMKNNELCQNYYYFLRREDGSVPKFKVILTSELDKKWKSIVKWFGGNPNKYTWTRQVVTKHPPYESCYDDESYEIVKNYYSFYFNQKFSSITQ